MNIEILIEHEEWNKFDVNKIASVCVDAVFSELKRKCEMEVCLLFTNDIEVKSLNKTYRGIDKPTNVLSFPSYSADDIELEDDKEENNVQILGSIAIAYETVEREASEQNKKIEDHLHHLIIHSVLHLLGYKHANDKEAKEMESIEIKILKHLSIKNPYI